MEHAQEQSIVIILDVAHRQLVQEEPVFVILDMQIVIMIIPVIAIY